ncbi:MAG: response regulator transcription factor [Deltaproteobacteria bacterium]|nr:response regulator transcription factor [Deltaproteobacteria bacterium]
MRLLIADDEAPLRTWLRQLVAEVSPGTEIVSEAADGYTALEQIEHLRPDAALLDIRMPGLSGLDVAARITVPCRIAFVTAYDEFALQAFEQAAVDYLLKPVTAERLGKTLQRLERIPESDVTTLMQQLLSRLNGPSPDPAFTSNAYSAPLRWLRVGDGDAVRLIDVNEVDHFTATDKYTTVHVGAKTWLIRLSLKELEQQLDSQNFWRIHRACLVRVAAIRKVRRDLTGGTWVELHSGGLALPVSRSHAHRLREM